MIRIKKNVIIMWVSFFCFVVTLGLIISISKIDKQTNETTTIYKATINDVFITDTGNNLFVEICTKEYDTSLKISTNISKNIKIDDITDLKEGQTIFFQIENIKVKQMNKVEFINITSLKTDTKEIFSLEEYNMYINNSAYPTRIVGIVMALLFLFVSIYCWNKHRTQGEHNGTVWTGDGSMS